MPDTIWGFVGSDTLTLAVHEGFSGGWSIRLFYKSPDWREVTRETLWIDTTPQLLLWTQYCQPPFQTPCKRIIFTYLENRLYYTAYRYDEPAFMPLWRSYAWGSFSTKTDNLLFGIVAEALWPGSPDTLNPVWPFPRQWRLAHWPDSSLTEAFDSTYQLFIELASLERIPASASCDSTLRYEGAVFFPVAVGKGLLCFPDGERLAIARDSLCDSSYCWLTQRTLTYTNGLPTSDTLSFTQYLRTGQTVASALFTTHYQYDITDRLVEVLAPNRRYHLSHSGQILTLPQRPLPGPLIRYSSTARWIQLENLSHPATLCLYDLVGNLLFSLSAPTDGLYALPTNLRGPCILQIRSYSGFLWQKLILLP